MSESVSALCNLKVKRLRLLCVGDSGAQVEAPGGRCRCVPARLSAQEPRTAPHSPAQFKQTAVCNPAGLCRAQRVVLTSGRAGFALARVQLCSLLPELCVCVCV